MGSKDERRILKYASKACPVVGDVMLSPPLFGGSRPNDTPHKSGSDSQSDGDDVWGAGALDTELEKTPSASDGGDSTSLESSDDGTPFAPTPTAEGRGRGCQAGRTQWTYRLHRPQASTWTGELVGDRGGRRWRKPP